MAKMIGVEGLTIAEAQSEIDGGARFVIYDYCISALIMTFRRSSDIYFVKSGENRVVKGLPYTLLSFFFGWWGFPWGLIYTPTVLYTNLSGGRDVTNEVMTSLTRTE